MTAAREAKSSQWMIIPPGCSAGIASQLLPRFGPRWVTFIGFVMSVIGLMLYWRLSPDSTYVEGVLPSIILMSLGFYYYYYLPSIFLCIALAAAFDHFGKGRFEHWDEGFAILAFGIAVYFFPIISAAALSGEQSFMHWMWYSCWS